MQGVKFFCLISIITLIPFDLERSQRRISTESATPHPKGVGLHLTRSFSDPLPTSIPFDPDWSK